MLLKHKHTHIYQQVGTLLARFPYCTHTFIIFINISLFWWELTVIPMTILTGILIIMLPAFQVETINKRSLLHTCYKNIPHAKNYLGNHNITQGSKYQIQFTWSSMTINAHHYHMHLQHIIMHSTFLSFVYQCCICILAFYALNQ